MNQAFAAFLRTERRRRKLSQAVLAQRAHVSERTIRYWEAGSTSPSQWELSSILTALELLPPERAHAMALLPIRPASPRSFRHDAAAKVDECGPAPALGDLLQAMRRRRGLTQGQMADGLNVSRYTILRWESTYSLPSEENVERLCLLLGAYPEERTALTIRRLYPVPNENAPRSLEEYAQEVEEFTQQTEHLQTPLIDLHALALKQTLWLRTGSSSGSNPAASHEAKLLLVRVQFFHSIWLMWHKRNAEAEAGLGRCLNLLRGHLASEGIWRAVINLAAYLAFENGGSEAGELFTKRWLPTFPKERQTTLWCDMALYAGRLQQHERAEFYLKQARRVLPYSDDVQLLTENYYPLTRAKTLMSAGRPWEAIEWLPPIPNADQPATAQAHYKLLWTQAFLQAGEKNAAQRNMDDLRVLFKKFPQPSNERKLSELTAQI